MQSVLLLGYPCHSESFHFSDHQTEPYFLGVLGAPGLKTDWQTGRSGATTETTHHWMLNSVTCATHMSHMHVCAHTHTRTNIPLTCQVGGCDPSITALFPLPSNTRASSRLPEWFRKRNSALNDLLKQAYGSRPRTKCTSVYVSACVSVLTRRKWRHQ